MLERTNLPARILVVDDHAQFRQFVSSTLEEQTHLTVIGQVEDGRDAVQQAEALQPDVILLDIRLPSLNGVEAARQIGQVASEARIIFLTQESSPEVVSEALALGACGYVVKAQAGTDLLAAVDSVLRGNRFVSSSLDGHGQPDSEQT